MDERAECRHPPHGEQWDETCTVHDAPARRRDGFGSEAESPMAILDPEHSHPVLIIEDEDELRDVLLVACELHGRTAIGVSGADEALDRLRGGLRRVSSSSTS
jgi:hypothetical protein